MCTSVIWVVDAIDSLTLSVIPSPALTSLSRASRLLARNSRIGQTEGNLVKSVVITLSWDFLVSTLTQPRKELHIATLFMAPVKAIGDKFDSAPAGLGFHRRGAPVRRNGIKR